MRTPVETNPDAYRFQGRGATRLNQGLLALMVICIALCGIFLNSPDQRRHVIFSYLVAFMFYTTISLGALFFVMLHHLTGARWSVVLRRLGEGLMMNFTIMLVLFIPVLIRIPRLYEWADPAKAAPQASALIHIKSSYLNPTFFTVRALFYFAVWITLAWILYRRSILQDKTGDPALGESMRRWSAPGMLLFAFTVTFAAFDWVMSLDAAWYSTIFGVYVFAGAVLAGLATIILVSLAVGTSSPAMGRAITVEHLHDLGKLLFAFVIFWAYIAFSQMMLIWMGNLPEETAWYARRWQAPGWRTVSILILVGHFALPFLFLLPRAIKRNRWTLGLAAAWILLIHYVDLYWLIMPVLNSRQVPLHWIDFVIWIGMGAMYFGVMLMRIQRQPLVPVRDPHLAESLAFENV